MQANEHDRRDWLIVLILLLFGLLLVLLAGGWAIRFASRWQLHTSMGSNLDPNSDYLTKRPGGPVEPLDSAILTAPVWFDVFLTPGAVIPTHPSPTGTHIPASTATATHPYLTHAHTPVSSPTSTHVYFPVTRTPTSNPGPVATRTLRPPRAATSTATASPSPTFTKTPLTLTRPATATTTFTSTATATSSATATATPTSTASPTPTQTPYGTATATPTHTATYTPTATGTATPTATSTFTPTPTDTPPPSADLQITMTDNTTVYSASIPIQYIVVVSNPAGPSDVTGAIVTGSLSEYLTNVTWSCSVTGGARCAQNGGANKLDDIVDLPVGSSITYIVNAVVSDYPSGPLDSSAAVSLPAGLNDPDLSNNTALDSDILVTPVGASRKFSNKR